MGGHNLQRPALAGFRSAKSAAKPSDLQLLFPSCDRIALPFERAALPLRTVEVEQTCLHSRVGFDPERLLVGPADPQPSRKPHNACGAVRLALQALGFVLCRIPLIADFTSRIVQWNARKVAFRRRHHAPSPVFIDH